MKKMMCSRCGKRPAMFFITKVEGNETKQEGLCMKCAMEMNTVSYTHLTLPTNSRV